MKTLVLLFTFELSLKDWRSAGLLSREVRYYKKWVDDGWSVVWMTYGDVSDLDQAEDLEGIQILPVYSVIKKSKFKFFRFIQSFFLFYYLKKYIDVSSIIKTNQMKGSWVAWGFKIFNKNRVIVRCGFQQLWTHFREARGFFHRWIKSLGYLGVEVLSHTLADLIIYTSQSSLDFVKILYFWIPKNKLLLIPNFIDTDLFNVSTVKQFNTKKALGVGRLNKIKRWPELFSSIQNKNWSLDVVGKGELESDLKNHVQNKSLPIHFLGVYSNSELARVYNKYSYFCLNSIFENNPKTLMEALSSGLICIAPDVVGINEILEDGVNGFIVKRGESFESVISKIEKTPQVDLEKVSDAARDYAVRHFNIDSIYDKEVKTIREVFK